MAYKTIFFDFGDTLAPDNPIPLAQRLRMSLAEALPEMMRSQIPTDDEALLQMHRQCSRVAGWPPDPGWLEQYDAFYQHWSHAMLKALTVAAENHNTMAPTLANSFRDVSDKTRVPFSDTFATLNALKGRNFRLGIVSNNDGGLARRLQYMKLDTYFEVVADSAIVRCNKPDPQIYKHALEAMKVDPKEVLHVGDLYDADVEGAGRAGIECAWLNRKSAAVPVSAYRPKYVISRLWELLDLLDAKGNVDHYAPTVVGPKP